MSDYQVGMEDNDTYAFRHRPAMRENTDWYELHQALVPNMSGTPRAGIRRCLKCGELLNKWEEEIRGVRVKKRRFDVSVTYDGVTIVSSAFRKWYESAGIEGLVITPLPDDPDFASIVTTTVVAFDSLRRHTRFLNACDLCGRYKEVIGANPVFLKPGHVVPARGFCGTDIEFGSGDGKHPLLLCGAETANLIVRAKLRGCTLFPIEN